MIIPVRTGSKIYHRWWYYWFLFLHMLNNEIHWKWEKNQMIWNIWRIWACYEQKDYLRNTIFKVFDNTNRIVIFKDGFCYRMVFPCYFLMKSIFTNLLIGRQDKCTLKMNSSVSTHRQHWTFALGSNPYVRKYSLFTLKFSTHNKLTQASKTCIAHSLPNGYVEHWTLYIHLDF